MTFSARLFDFLDKLLIALHHPYRPPLWDGNCVGVYDPDTKIIHGWALIRVLREQQPAKRANGIRS